MKKKLFIIIIVIILTAAISVVFLGIGIIKGENSIFEEPIISPSGNYMVEKVHGCDNARYVKFVISPTMSIGESFVCETKFYTRFALIAEWDGADRWWVYSSDTGTYFWELKNSEWIRVAADESNIKSAPEAIKKKYKG